MKRDQWIALLEHFDLRDDEIRASNTSQVDDKPVDVAAIDATDGNPVVTATGNPQKRKRTSGDETSLQKRRKTVAQQPFQVPQPISPSTAQHEQLDNTDTELQKPTQVQHVPAFLERTEDSPSNPLPRDQIEEPEAPNYNEDVQMTDVGVTVPAHAEEPGKDVGIQVVSHTADQTVSGVTPNMPSAAPTKLDKQTIKQSRKPPVRKAPKFKLDTKAVQKKNMAPEQIREATAAMGTDPATNEAIESLKGMEHQPGIVDMEDVEISDERPRVGVVKPPSPKRSRRLAKTTETHSKEQNTTGNDRTAKKPLVVSSNVDTGSSSFLDTSISGTQNAEANPDVTAEGYAAVTVAEDLGNDSASESVSDSPAQLEASSGAQVLSERKNNSKLQGSKYAGVYTTGLFNHIPTKEMDKKLRPEMLAWHDEALYWDRREEERRLNAIKEGSPYEPPKYDKPYDWRDEFKGEMR